MKTEQIRWSGAFDKHVRFIGLIYFRIGHSPLLKSNLQRIRGYLTFTNKLNKMTSL